MDIDHIGYLVKNINKAQELFLQLGFCAEGKEIYDPLRDVTILFLSNGAYRVELIAPQSEKSVVWETWKKLGNTPYHICYRCEKIQETLKEWEQKGFTQAGEPQPAPACGGKNVCFLYHRSIGIIELLEEDQNVI